MDHIPQKFFARCEASPVGLSSGGLSRDDNLALDGVVSRIIAQVEGKHIRRRRVVHVVRVQAGDRGVIHDGDAQASQWCAVQSVPHRAPHLGCRRGDGTVEPADGDAFAWIGGWIGCFGHV